MKHQAQKKLEFLKVTASDFEASLKMVQPSAMREVLVEMPDVHWKDNGGRDSVKEENQQAVEWPLKYEDVYKQFAAKSPQEFLMFGHCKSSGKGIEMQLHYSKRT